MQAALSGHGVLRWRVLQEQGQAQEEDPGGRQRLSKVFNLLPAGGGEPLWVP